MSLNPDVKLLCQSIFNFKSSSRYLANWGIAAEMEITCGDLFINFGFCILLGDLSDSNLESEGFDHQVMMWLTEDWISCKKQLPW